MDFESLKKTWQEGNSTPPSFKEKLASSGMLQQLEKIQRRIVFNNLFASLAMIVLIVALPWLWAVIPDRSIFFYSGIVIMGIVVVAMLILLWLRVLYWNNNVFGKDNIKFINLTLRRLQWNKTLTNVIMPIYGFLLWLALVFCFYDMSELFGEPMYTLVQGGTTLYVIIVMYFGIRHKKKQHRQTLDPIIEELEALKTDLQNA